MVDWALVYGRLHYKTFGLKGLSLLIDEAFPSGTSCRCCKCEVGGSYSIVDGSVVGQASCFAFLCPAIQLPTPSRSNAESTPAVALAAQLTRRVVLYRNMKV